MVGLGTLQGQLHDLAEEVESAQTKSHKEDSPVPMLGLNHPKCQVEQVTNIPPAHICQSTTHASIKAKKEEPETATKVLKTRTAVAEPEVLRPSPPPSAPRRPESKGVASVASFVVLEFPASISAGW
ncbi:ribosomal RNA large subunit methyltransferase E [Striga asiatica]|uniref:Ribosomal RNA large subunit methyltransferase E n=1 Tax=Striga asiatica TaxID=4170 RepID=A0A5A7QJR2_STRAF|nr:ribosomal RNA large subunit methyltransferase E [Striga asiatica]